MKIDIKERCRTCIQIDRHWEKSGINPSIRTIRSYYNSRIDETGLEIGCNPRCPFLKKSIKALG